MNLGIFELGILQLGIFELGILKLIRFHSIILNNFKVWYLLCLKKLSYTIVIKHNMTIHRQTKLIEIGTLSVSINNRFTLTI